MLRKRMCAGVSLAVLTVILNGGCSSDVTTSIKSQGEREYVVSVQHKGAPMLSVECTYLGKAPADEEKFRSTFQHDWSVHDTDFYRMTFENESGHAVSVQSVDYRMDVGAYRGKSHFESKAIASTWGSSKIEPGESVSRDTHFVWAVKGDNVLYKLYRFRTQNDAGEPVEFEVELPLRYQR